MQKTPFVIASAGTALTARLLYRIAAIALLLFAAGHTIGFLSFRPESAEGRAVYESMQSVHFEFNGAPRSYGEFYKGFALMVTAYLLFGAFLSWHLGRLAARQPGAIGALAWVFAAVQLAVLALTVLYFFIVPVVLCAIIFACLLGAAWLLRRARSA